MKAPLTADERSRRAMVDAIRLCLGLDPLYNQTASVYGHEFIAPHSWMIIEAQREQLLTEEHNLASLVSVGATLSRGMMWRAYGKAVQRPNE